jgi:acetolactate synthase small subunit
MNTEEAEMKRMWRTVNRREIEQISNSARQQHTCVQISDYSEILFV